jgi:hypothetical protein
LSCTIDDGGSTESIGKTIPIFLKTINLTAVTESGLRFIISREFRFAFIAHSEATL